MPSAEHQDAPLREPDHHTVQVQQLFVRHQSEIRAFILSLEPRFDIADDLLQETFLVVTRKAPEFEIGSRFVSWAFAIARFKVLESRRASSREHPLSDEVIELLAAEAPAGTQFDSRLHAVRQCLSRLAPKAREIVHLRYFSGHGPEEIAEGLSWSANAVNVALSKARSWLRSCVEREMKEGA